MLSHLSDSLDQFPERDLIFATCKCNNDYLKSKTFSSSHI